MEMHDPFARARDLLTLLFPLFTAVISFYFGVTVEGRRADQSAMRANHAEKDIHEMEGKITDLFSDLSTILAVNVINAFVISIQFTGACTLTIICNPEVHLGTLLDRIDIHIEVPRVDHEKLSCS